MLSGSSVRFVDSDDATRLLSVGAPGSSLKVTIRRHESRSVDEPWFDTEVVIEALPFTGTLQTVFTLTDLRTWLAQLGDLTGGTGRAVLGGNRAAELVIDAEPQVGGGRSDAVALSIGLTPSGDDPYPSLRYLIFDVPKVWSRVDPHALD